MAGTSSFTVEGRGHSPSATAADTTATTATTRTATATGPAAPPTSSLLQSDPRSKTKAKSNSNCSPTPNLPDSTFHPSSCPGSSCSVRPTPNLLRQPNTPCTVSPSRPGSNITTAAGIHPNNTAGLSSGNSGDSGNDQHRSVLDAHRQSHSSSKLPAFRFADRKQDAQVLPRVVLQQHDPPSPVSLTPAPAPAPTNPGCRSGKSTDDGRLDQTQPRSHQDHQDHQDHRQQQQQQQQQRHQQQQQQHHQHHQPRDSQDQSGQSSSQQTKPARQTRRIPASSPDCKAHNRDRNPKNYSVSPQSQPESRSRSQSHPDPSSRPSSPTICASTAENALPSADPVTSPSPSSCNRPASLPGAPAAVAKLSCATTIGESPPHQAPESAGLETTGTSRSQRPRLTHTRRTVSDSATKDLAQGRRDLLLPKTIDTAKSDDKRRSRPPTSFRQPTIAAATPGAAAIPPIRSFRSSGSRKSLVLDDSSDGSSDPTHRGHTPSSLEGRADSQHTQMTLPGSAAAASDENTADIFMRIAGEDPAPNGRDGNGAGGEPSTFGLTRLRSSHRRPYSTAIPSQPMSSPPQFVRRLSDQQETSKRRRMASDRPAQQMTRELNYGGMAREQPQPSPATRSEEPSRTPAGRIPTLKPSPITPRTLAFQDSHSEVGSTPSRRRPSITDNNGGLSSRTSQLKSTNFSFTQGRTYNSSPLVPRSIDVSSHHHETPHGVEGTESSAASTTAAPSMIWDELDDLKSRIHRLELTGKPPATSAQAMSRVSDERPPTAVTNATTMSASPKRSSATNPPQADEVSTTSSQRESQPILLTALSNTKCVVSSDVYSAIKSAADDALSLASMMGAPGQPGPISSGASTIGVGGVTDRQLRKKAESICRSLTELCLALTEETTTKPTQVVVSSPREKENFISPSTFKFSGITGQRRPSGGTLLDQGLPKLKSSPRAPTSLERKRTMLLGPTAFNSSRFANVPETPTDADGAGRMSSLLLPRARRVGTDEPEESPGRKTSLLLRTRRAETEEPEEGRKTSLLLRTRRSSNEEDESRIRAPSRAITEVNQSRIPPRDFTFQQEPTLSALPRRRFAPSGLSSRLLAPSSPTKTTAAVTTPPASMSGRRFFERPTPDRDSSSVTEKLADDRAQRQFALSQAGLLGRSGSLSRRRDSAIPSFSGTPQSGAYRQ